MALGMRQERIRFRKKVQGSFVYGSDIMGEVENPTFCPYV